MAEQRTLFAFGAPPPVVDRGAVISPDGLYRYRLWRTWEPARPAGWLLSSHSKRCATNNCE